MTPIIHSLPLMLEILESLLLMKVIEQSKSFEEIKVFTEKRKMASFCKLFSMMDCEDTIVLLVGLIGWNLVDMVCLVAANGNICLSMQLKDLFAAMRCTHLIV